MGRKPKTTEALAVSMTVSVPMHVAVEARRLAGARYTKLSHVVSELLERWIEEAGNETR